MKRVAFVLLATACGSSKPAPVADPNAGRTVPTCAGPETKYGVVPFKDKTGKHVDVSGMDQLLAVELSKDPCVVVVERARLQPVIDEIAHCDADNPDRDQFDCSTFAPSGQILGIQYMVFGDVVMYEPSITGAHLAGHTQDHTLDAAGNYAAIAVATRAVSVETGKVVGGETVESLVPSGDAKLDAHSAQASSPAVTTLITKIAVRVHTWH